MTCVGFGSTTPGIASVGKRRPTMRPPLALRAVFCDVAFATRPAKLYAVGATLAEVDGICSTCSSAKFWGIARWRRVLIVLSTNPGRLSPAGVRLTNLTPICGRGKCNGGVTMANHAELTEEKSVEWCKELMMQPPGAWPSDKWVGFPNIIRAIQELFAEAAAKPPSPPKWLFPAGIVICAGGWRFFASLYVTIRVIRQTGCTLPIQVWYLGDAGEFDPRMAECLADWGVGWIDANSWWRENPQYTIRRKNIDNGWMLKPFAALGCPFQTVLLLDADSYPAYNPEKFMAEPEFQRVGAAFWPDNSPLEPGQWARFGVPPQNCPGIESGQFIVDKGRHWRPLWAACLLNAMWDFTYKHIYGDKDTFNLAWRKCGHEMCVPTEKPGWHVAAFLQRDFKGNTLFVHRTRDKFRLSGDIDGQGISQWFMTRQQGPANKFIRDLPFEQFGHDVKGEVDQLLRPEAHFDTLGHDCIRDEWQTVNRRNCYRFRRDYKPGDVAIDVGANVGAATHALLSRGMSHVFAVEPFAANARRIRMNLQQWGGRYTLLEAAAWISPESPPSIPLFARDDDRLNTGNYNCFVPSDHKALVKAVPFDDVVRSAAASPSGRVRLVKIDAEGAEYPILFSSRLLHLVDEIVGEWHRPENTWEPSAEAKPFLQGWVRLMMFLAELGFVLQVENFGSTNGLFWARRKP